MRLSIFIIRIKLDPNMARPDGISVARWRAMISSFLDHEKWSLTPHGN